MLVRQAAGEKPGREVSTYPSGVKIARGFVGAECILRFAVTERHPVWQSAVHGFCC